MKTGFNILTIAIIGCLSATTLLAQTITRTLESKIGLELVNVQVDVVEHMHKKGIQVTKASDDIEGETLVIISGITFANGTISLELTGEPAADAAPTMRGFVGLAFHLNPEDNAKYDCFYLRPTNARADNQLLRNHTTQYISHPEYPWHALRKESPGLYESYVDVVPGEWTKIKIEIDGKNGRLFLHGNDQPCLIINDLKGQDSGKIALWMHSSTKARFRNLQVTSN